MTDQGPIVRSSRPSGGGHEVGEVGLAHDHDIPVSGPPFPHVYTNPWRPSTLSSGAEERANSRLQPTLHAACYSSSAVVLAAAAGRCERETPATNSRGLAFQRAVLPW